MSEEKGRALKQCELASSSCLSPEEPPGKAMVIDLES